MVNNARCITVSANGSLICFLWKIFEYCISQIPFQSFLIVRDPGTEYCITAFDSLDTVRGPSTLSGPVNNQFEYSHSTWLGGLGPYIQDLWHVLLDTDLPAVKLSPSPTREIIETLYDFECWILSVCHSVAMDLCSPVPAALKIARTKTRATTGSFVSLALWTCFALISTPRNKIFHGLEIQNLEKLKPELRRSTVGRRRLECYLPSAARRT